MTTIEIEEIYKLGYEIYNKENTIEKAKIYMETLYPERSKNSIRYYLVAIVAMLEGTSEFKQKISTKALKYFFEQIITDFKNQENVIENAFKAVEFHLEYQQNSVNSVVKDSKELYNNIKAKN